MYYTVSSEKPFERVVADLKAAARRSGLELLHVHDLGGTLRGTGADFGNECRLFEVCKPDQVRALLASDMRLCLALPCRIAVYTEGGSTRIGLIRPLQLLAALSDDAQLRTAASALEATLVRIADAARK